MELPTETSCTIGLHTVSRWPQRAQLEPGSDEQNGVTERTTGIYTRLFAWITLDPPLLEGRRFTARRHLYHASLAQVNPYA
jgi:hypothetical protein